MADSPQISVLLSTYNNARYVGKKLGEITRQSFFDQAEFIFVETDSPERERDLIRPYTQKFPNIRLFALDERKTLYESWNIGWEQARAPLLCNSNMDDFMHPALLEKVVRCFQKHPKTELCSVLIARQTEGEGWNDFSSSRVLNRKLSLRPGPFFAWKNSLADKIGRFDPEFFSKGDKDFWSRAYAHGVNIRLIWKVLYLYTVSASQLSKQKNDKNRMDSAREAGKPYPSMWAPRYKARVKMVQPFWRLFPNLFLERQS